MDRDSLASNSGITEFSLVVGHRARIPPRPAHQNSLQRQDRKSTRLNSSHVSISYAVFCLKKKRKSPPQDYALRSMGSCSSLQEEGHSEKITLKRLYPRLDYPSIFPLISKVTVIISILYN